MKNLLQKIVQNHFGHLIFLPLGVFEVLYPAAKDVIKMGMTIFVDHIRNSKNNEKILSPDRGFKLDRDGNRDGIRDRDRDRGNRDDRDGKTATPLQSKLSCRNEILQCS